MSRPPTVFKHQFKREQYDDVLHALEGHEDGLTARDVGLETHRSTDHARTILNELREAGRVRRFQDPDDGRICRYAIDGGNGEVIR